MLSLRHLRRSAGDRGSALMLMPACVLVVLLLASIAVDMALVHLRQRQALDLAASAANDAVTAGADPARIRLGDHRLDPVRVEQAVDQAVAASDLAPHLVGRATVRIEGAVVEVELTVAADHLFTAAVPGAPDESQLTARASARPESP